MKKILALLSLVLAVSFPAYQIVLSPEAIAPEKTAASELAKYLPKLSKNPAAVEIVASSKEHPAIHVGRTPAALKAFGLSSWEALQPDEVLYKVTDDGDLWIAGQGTRGTLYAVYEFLEREYGVRFLTADVEYIPQSEEFSLPAIRTSHRYVSPFISRRSAYYLIPLGGPEFACKCRNNLYLSIPEEWGGVDSIIGFVHTMDQMFPEKDYFAEHPEWFALRNGTRSAGPFSQMCLTNPEMREELVRQVRKRLREDGGKSHFISVTQNDNSFYCQCERCNAFVEEYGNQTDLFLDCVNYVADAIRDEFPQVYVETIAYTYTRQPPVTIRPRDNVAIQYATIEARSFFPLESPQNQKLFDELSAWRKIAKKMLIWNYVTDFAAYYRPHPNWHIIAQDLRLFRDSNAISIFEQGSHFPTASICDLDDMRNYIVSRLLWNPDSDDGELMREFCSLYYGPAAPYVYAYVDGVTALAKAHPEAEDTCYAKDTRSWMSNAELASLWRKVYDGVELLKDDPVYGPRMDFAAIPITMDLVEREEILLASKEERFPEVRDVDSGALIDWCQEVLERAKGHDSLKESGGLTISRWVNRYGTLHSGKILMPEAACAGERPEELPEGDWWGWNIEELGPLLVRTKETCCLMEDPAAVGGKAAQMPNIHTQWYVQATELPRANFDLYLTVRCDLKPGCPAEGDAMTCGSYPAGPVKVTLSAAELAGPEYKLVHVGRSELPKANYVYCAPVINPNVERIWIDRLIVLNPQDDDGNPLEIPSGK